MRKTDRALRQRCLGRVSLVLLLVALLAPVGPAARPAAAQQDWHPFSDALPPGTGRRPARPAPAPPIEAQRRDEPTPTGYAADGAAPGQAGSPPVERSDLPPLPGQDQAAATDQASPAPTMPTAASGEAGNLARQAAELTLPPRSGALARLLVQLLGPTAGDPASPEDSVARAHVLYRMGRVAEADAVMSQHMRHGPSDGPASELVVPMAARLALAVGDADRACRHAQGVVQSEQQLAPVVRAEAIAIGGWCGARLGNHAAAGLAAGLAREQGGLQADTQAALDALGVGEMPALQASRRIGVLDWRLSEASGRLEQAQVPLDRLEPAALVAVAMSRSAPARLRVPAAEVAARLGAIDAVTLAEVFRQAPFTPAELADAQGGRAEAWARRALLLRTAESERTPFKRTRLIRAALDDARRAGLYRVTAAALTRVVDDIRPVQEIGWFAETAVEIHVAAGRLGEARRWVEAGAGGDGRTLAHWLALIDIADPALRGQRGATLVSLEELALRGRFTPEGLHRLATVLDALDYHVPVRLWEAASRAPQPTTGHLPPTGVLADLQSAARAKDAALTALLVLRTLGPDGPEGSHMIALGDAIRALRRAGLEEHARGIAVEALFALWPRVSSG